MRMLPRFATALMIAVLAVGGSASIGRAADDEKDFTPLFTGRDLSGWRMVSASKNRWKVTSDRVLENAWTKDHPSTDLISEKTFWNFMLRLDFLVHQGGNSGVYLRGRHEIQLIDDDASRQLSAVSNGAIFNQVSPSVFASRPSGEWQTLEATMVGNTITVLLNGKKIHDRVPCPKPTDKPLDTKVNTPGPILLQGRLGEVKFRNVRLKVLP